MDKQKLLQYSQEYHKDKTYTSVKMYCNLLSFL